MLEGSGDLLGGRDEIGPNRRGQRVERLVSESNHGCQHAEPSPHGPFSRLYADTNLHSGWTKFTRLRDGQGPLKDLGRLWADF